MRRIVGVVALVVAIGVLPGAVPVGAQACPGRVSPPCPSDIGGEGETPGETPTETPPANPPGRPVVGGDTATPPTPNVGGNPVTPPAAQPASEGPSVLGSRTVRLPLTGQDISAVGVLGLALTAAGVGFALAGRRRRTHFDTAV